MKAAFEVLKTGIPNSVTQQQGVKPSIPSGPILPIVSRGNHAQTLSQLAMLGKSQVRFGEDETLMQRALKQLDRKYVNEENQVYTGGEILLYLLRKAMSCDGERGPSIPADKGRTYPNRYQFVMDNDLGFRDSYIQDKFIRGLWQAGVFDDNGAKPMEKMYMTRLGRDVALSWEARDAKQMYSNVYGRAAGLAFLHQKFLTKDSESVSAGQILADLAKRSAECDGKTGIPGVPVEDVVLESRYLSLIMKDHGIDEIDTLRQIASGFKRHKFFATEDDRNWKEARLTAYGREAAVVWEQETMKKLPPPKPKEPDKYQYVTPPVDLTKKKLEEVISIANFPPEVMAKIKEKMQSAKSGTESGKVAPWMNATMRLPWVNETVDRADIKQARELLDKNFYGMDALKNRLLEEISVRQFKGGNKGGIILLVGPPGTGKTAVAKVLAEAMGRKFVRRSLAGISDAQKITGHDYTYVGAKHGIIMDGMMEAGTKNPLFQIDEIDKVGQHGSHGNPLDALLAVLDPQQNDKFTDSYLDYPFDLSKTLFVCTANRLEDFPAPLLSRTEVIHFDSYLPDEKIEIATRHLIPKQYGEYNIPQEKLSFERDAVEHIIKNYTREGGVRKLEQRIQAMFRKASFHFATNPDSPPVSVTKSLVDQWLPHSLGEKSINASESHIGVVNGLYYSENGGGVMPVQTLVSPGVGKLILTGKIGEVMQEAAKVALSFIAKNALELGIDEKTRDALQHGKLDIHIHYPDGATPKDGPSAGSSTFLSLWSSLSQTPIPANIAMTGEIDLKGNVNAIGGVLEKVSGAIAQGVQTIFLPKANEKDFTDLTSRSAIFKKLTENHEIKFVQRASDLVANVQAKNAASKPVTVEASAVATTDSPPAGGHPA
jgi:endopeptidase La